MINNITLKEQSSVRITYNNLVIYFDPYLLNFEYNHDADYIFITHSHYDHYSKEDILSIKNNNTKIIIPYDLKDDVYKIFNKENVLLVKSNNKYKIDNISFNTVPAYNINKIYHKLELNWVGYIVNLGKKIYFAGDTDNIEEGIRFSTMKESLVKKDFDKTKLKESILTLAELKYTLTND